MDGDKALEKDECVNLFLRELETTKDPATAEVWIRNRLLFLPGDVRPEKWLLLKVNNDITERLAKDFGASMNDLQSYIDESLSSREHEEVRVFSQKLNLSTGSVQDRLIRAALRRSESEVKSLCDAVSGFLK